MLRSGCYLRVGVMGVNYKTADLSLRESFARAAQKIAGERALFFKHPTVILSTCNRTEIYFSAEDLAEAHSDLLLFLRSHIGEVFEHRIYAYFGIDCFSHLSKVASGLDSAILAENEIQRQVKLSYLQSSSMISLPSCMHYVFQKALRVAKVARNSIPIEKSASTLYGTLWQIGQSHFSDLSERRILLVGYSEINRGFATFIMRRGIQKFFLATRHSHAQMEGAIVGSRDLLKHWSDFDWIVCAAKSDQYLIRGEARKSNLIVDLSVPRNADPDIQGGASLWNIEQIDQLVEKNRRMCSEKLEQCESMIQENVCRQAGIYRAKIERGLCMQPQTS